MFKRLLCWAYFRGSLFLEGLIIGRNFAFQNGLGLTIKQLALTVHWANIREGLLSEGFLRLRFEELIFGRACFFGGAYYRNFTVYMLCGIRDCRHVQNSQIICTKFTRLRCNTAFHSISENLSIQCPER